MTGHPNKQTEIIKIDCAYDDIFHLERYNVNRMGSEGSVETNDWMRNLEKETF